MRNYKCDPLMMGQRLKELRRNAKNSMSQLAFAEEIGTCLGNISKIEQGLRFPTMEILYDYMNYFDGDANLLCGCDIENQNRTLAGVPQEPSELNKDNNEKNDGKNQLQVAGITPLPVKMCSLHLFEFVGQALDLLVLSS